MDVSQELAGLVGPAVARLMARRGAAGASRNFLAQAASQSHDEILADLVKNFRPEWAEEFKKVHKVIEHPATGSSMIVPRVGPIDMTPLESMGEEGKRALVRSQEADLKMRTRGVRRGRDYKKKVYKLSALLFDPEVSAKLEMSQAEVQVLRRTAVLDPMAAAQSAQAELRHKGCDCIVSPGDYAQGLKAARARLHRAVEKSNITPPQIRLEVIGQQCIAEGPRTSSGEFEWTVMGPASCSPEVIAVARLAVMQGANTTRVLFEKDTVTCGVSLIEPLSTIAGFQYHVGLHDDYFGIAGSDGYQHPDFVRAAARRIMPLFIGGRVVATAVRSTTEEAYANWHVLEYGGEGAVITASLPGSIPSAPVEYSLEVAADIWLISHPTADLDAGAWVQREADEMESAVLVYATRDGVEYSDTVVVQRVESGSVVVTKPPQARPGISGAALVALSDGALLGVYRGASLDLCSCAVVAPASQAYTSTEVTAVGRARGAVEVTEGDSAYQSLASRGLDSVLRKSVQALRQLYKDGEHVGYAVRYGAGSYTTLDCDVWSLSDGTGRPVNFRRVQADKFSCESEPEQVPLSFVRLPRVSEKVYVVGCDSGGVYVSASMYITRLASDGHSFWLSDDPERNSEDAFVYAGALVIAESDASVVGQFVGATATGTGRMSKCVGFIPRSLDQPARRDLVLNSMARGVMVELWDPDALEKLIARDQETILRYAQLGNYALQCAVVVQNARDADGAGQAAALAVVTDSGWIVSRAVDCDFPRALKSPSGSLVRPAERLADAFRAFFGMLATFQGQSAVENALRHMGWFDFIWSDELGRLGIGHPYRTSVYSLSGQSRTSTPSPHRSPIVSGPGPLS